MRREHFDPAIRNYGCKLDEAGLAPAMREMATGLRAILMDAQLTA